MIPLPDYRNAKPRGGWTVHDPIWRSQPKWGEAPSRQLVMGMLPPTIPPGTSRFPTKLHIPIARTHQRLHGAMGYCGECAEMRFQHCHQAKSARNPRLRRVGIWAPRWVALVRACSRSIIRCRNERLERPAYTHGSVDQPAVSVNRSDLATALPVEHGHEGEWLGTSDVDSISTFAIQAALPRLVIISAISSTMV